MANHWHFETFWNSCEVTKPRLLKSCDLAVWYAPKYWFGRNDSQRFKASQSSCFKGLVKWTFIHHLLTLVSLLTCMTLSFLEHKIFRTFGNQTVSVPIDFHHMDKKHNGSQWEWTSVLQNIVVCVSHEKRKSYRFEKTRRWVNDENEWMNEWMNEWCIYIALYCVLPYTQSALQSCGGSLLQQQPSFLRMVSHPGTDQAQPCLASVGNQSWAAAPQPYQMREFFFFFFGLD